jgi:hypothetical protein
LLRAARDDVPGTYRFETEYYPGEGFDPLALNDYVWQLLGNRTAVIQHERGYDMSTDPRDVWSASLPIEHFESCLEQDFGPTLFNCLTAVGLPPATICPVCPE